jgi:hypothetical protein
MVNDRRSGHSSDIDTPTGAHDMNTTVHTTALEAIAESVQRSCIAHAVDSPDIRDDLLTLCDDCETDCGDYWGTNDEGDAWRVQVG